MSFEEQLKKQSFLKLKFREYTEESKQIINYKLKVINSLIYSLKEENEKLIAKSKFLIKYFNDKIYS